MLELLMLNPRPRSAARSRRKKSMKMTKSHPVARALRRGVKIKTAWRLFKAGRLRRTARRRPAKRRRRNTTGVPFSGRVYRPAFKRKSKGRHPMAFSLNPRGRRRRKSSRRRSSRRRRSNPLLQLNRPRRGRRRSCGRRARRRGRRRNPGIMRLFNPFGGNLIGRVVSRVKSVASPRVIGQVAGGTAGFAVSWAAPSYLLPQYDYGWKGLGLSAGAAVAASIVVGMAAPAFAPIVLIGGLVGTVVKAIMQNARQILLPQSGMAGFLTTTTPRRQMGQIPANLIAGMGDFVTLKQQYGAMGPASAAALQPSGRYSNAS